MGIFSGMKDASTSGSGRNIIPGQWEMEVRQLLIVESQQRKGETFFVAEFDVLAVEAPADYEGKFPFKAGDEVSWLVKMSQPSALGNIKAFAMAIVPGEVTEADIDEEMMEDMISSDQPTKGRKVFGNAFQIKTRANTDFTVVKWSNEEPEENDGK